MSRVVDEFEGVSVGRSPSPMPPPPSSMNPFESLSPTASRILKAARRVAIKGGYRALSFQSVAEAAKVPKSTVVYHFRNKESLLAALLESLVHEQNTSAVEAMEALPDGPERVRVLLERHSLIARNTDYWRLVFALMPEITRRRSLRKRFGEIVDWYWALILHGLGLPEAAGGRSLIPLASVLLAVLDGLAMQMYLTSPDQFDLDARFAVWAEIIEPYMRELMSSTPVPS
jgi:AcrR family transcriptional regulator